MANTPNDWDALESLIDRVLDAPPEARSALIAQVTGADAARRGELERLVAECERTYPLLDRPVAERFGALLEGETMRVPALLADRYRIVRELGHGGMAVVYLAHDVKHERDVAVKIIRPELAATLGRARFLREISIAAKLKHPHIVPLFDSGEVDGLLYYVMPYQEEPSLRARLKRDGALSVDDTIAILRDVCDALAYAHQQGVVHRDIKPDNVLLSGRHALVTDFGVARAVTAAVEQETLTTAGGVVGTAAYMAPEQASASSQVDHRVDIYAVGVMAYEMLTGERPFSGDTPASQWTSHSAKAAVDLTRLRRDVPSTLAALVMKCLAAQPAARHQRAEDVLAGLGSRGSIRMRRRVTPLARRSLMAKVAVVVLVAGIASLLWAVRPTSRTTAPRAVPQLAVLVFQYGGNEELEPLAMGLTDNLIGSLGDVPGLVVRSMSAVLPYRNSLTPIDSLARRLDVMWVVDGRVYRVGQKTIALAQLTDAASGRLIARSEAAAAIGEDAKLTEELIGKVATMLRDRVTDHVRVEGWRAGTKSDKAFADVNRAHAQRRDANRLAAARDVPGAWLLLRRADSMFASAARADARWAEPLIQRSWVALNIANMLFGSGIHSDSGAQAIQRGLTHARAALRLAPASPHTYEALGMILHAKSQFAPGDESAAALLATAEQLLRQASDGDTTLVRAATVLGRIYYLRGDYEHAHLMATRAYAADAFTTNPQPMLSSLFFYSFEDRDDLEARSWCARYGALFPTDWFSAFCRLTLMVWDTTETPHADTAMRIVRSATASTPDVIRPPVAAQLQMLYAGVLARLGKQGSARRVLADVRAAMAADPSVAREPFGSELLEIETGVRVRLGQLDTASAVLGELLKRHPDRRAGLSRSRRFSALPTALLRDAAPPR